MSALVLANTRVERRKVAEFGSARTGSWGRIKRLYAVRERAGRLRNAVTAISEFAANKSATQTYEFRSSANCLVLRRVPVSNESMAYGGTSRQDQDSRNACATGITAVILDG